MAELHAKRLTLTQAKEIYDRYMGEDFPPEELKPFRMIEDMYDRGHYLTYGFYETVETEGMRKEVLRAYAFFVADHANRMLLLDYFAACADIRSRGYGSAALRQMREIFADWKGIVIEVEDDEIAAEESIRDIRKRRIAFYTRNGCCMTSTRSYVFGVDYRIMVLPITDGRAGECLAQKVTDLYRCMHNEDVLRKMFKITAE